MTDRNAYFARKVTIPDHLWQLFEEMAAKMGTERDGLVCQAMFVFARLNGFIDAPGIHQTVSGPSMSSSAPTPAVAVTAPSATLEIRERPGPAEPTGPMPTTGALSAVPEQTADVSVHPGVLADADDGLEVERGQLYVITESGNLDRVIKDRFVIGRGKHCDFVIHSGKVSREHAVVVREGSDWYIEDLGSSNGTWFNKQRVKRRRVEDGDEYYICNEKIKFVLR
jgi:hypothetical protein